MVCFFCGERRIRTFEACAADLQSALVGHLSISPKFKKNSSFLRSFCDLTVAYFDYAQHKLLAYKIYSHNSDLAGARTQDHLLKREVLYQLSYQVILFLFSGCKYNCKFYKNKLLFYFVSFK